MSIINEYMNTQNEYIINLDSNEIYLSIDEKIFMKMKSCLTKIDLHRYPTNDMKEIKDLYANYAGVRAKNIIVTNGSDEALELVISKFIRSDKKVLTISPDFVMYDFYIERFGGKIRKYDIGRQMKFDVDSFIKFAEKENADLIVFSNPNNPTGIKLTSKEIIKILEAFKDKPILIDEAYYEFNGESVVSYINIYRNLYVTRTLSKAWGLAALRMGFLITHEENIKDISKYKVPYTVSSYSQNLAEVVLKYPSRVINNVKKVIEQREKLYLKLKDIEKNAAMNINFFESKGNFIYGKTKHKEALQKGMKKNGIRIRYFDDNTFRITVGSPMENRKVIEALKNIFGCA